MFTVHPAATLEVPAPRRQSRGVGGVAPCHSTQREPTGWGEWLIEVAAEAEVEEVEV